MDDAVTIRVHPAVIELLASQPKTTLAPGVVGFLDDYGVEVRVGLIIAVDEGSGAVGRFLDSLPGDRKVRVENVVSGRLAGMVQRRGFVSDAGDWSRG
jgi:hypothetical protein